MIDERELERRFEALRGSISAAGSMAGGVMSRIQESREHAPRKRRPRRSWLVRSAVALAGAAVVAAVAWLPLAPTTRVAYGIDDLLDALLKVKSIHVKSHIRDFDEQGKMIHEGTAEWFCERPYRSWSQGVGFSNQHPPRIGCHARDGVREKHLDTSTQQCTLSDDSPLMAELSVEGSMQSLLLFGREGTTPEQFRKVGKEKIDGQAVDRYERIQLADEARKDGYREVVWLNPATALPVRSAHYRFSGRNADDLRMSVVEDVEFNVPPRPEMFDFAPPEGYTVIDKRGAKERLSYRGGAAVNAERIEFGPPALNIDDRALLVCWAAYDASQEPALEVELDGPTGRVIAPEKFSVLSGPNKYRHVFLRADRAERFHWRWSLFVPEDPQRRIGWDSPTLRMKCGASSASLAISGLRFPRDRLARLIIELQRLTLPPDAPESVALTLDAIEELIGAAGDAQPKRPAGSR